MLEPDTEAFARPTPQAAEPSERARRENTPMTVLSAIMTRVVSPVARMVYRPTVEGLENIPGTGPVILAANHLSFVDSMIIPIVVPRRVYFLAKAEYFEGTGVRGALSRWLFP